MKKNQKKNKKKVAAIVVTPELPKSNKPFLLISVIVFLSVLILGILSCILFLTVLIQFTKLRDIKHQPQDPVEFSYFITRPDQLSSSKALIVYDKNAQAAVLSKNENVRFAPASTAKIMTAIIVLEHFDPDTILKADSSSVYIEGSKMGLFLGEEIKVRDLMYGMMLPSGNDAAHLLASSYPGGVEAFVSRMNEKARELKLENTHFVDPAGYGDDNYSTAYDMARLGAYALENSLIAQIVKTPEALVYNVNQTIPHSLKNLNELLQISGVNGIKTGFTNEAEGVLVTSFLFKNKQYIIVVLRSKDRFQDTKELLMGIIDGLRSEQVTP